MNTVRRTIGKTRPVFTFVIQRLLATAIVISIVETHADTEEKVATESIQANHQPVAVNPYQYNTVADYDRWKMVTDSSGKEVGVWSNPAAAKAPTDQPSQEAPRTKRSIPGIAIAALVMMVAGGLSRLRR